MITRHADTVAEITRCYPLMRQLRPHLNSASQFLEIYRRQSAGGYRLLVRWSGETPVALAGYRVSENLIHGQHVYIDDLVTDTASRTAGHGTALLEFLRNEARDLGCKQLVLDTAVSNLNARRFYQDAGLLPEGLHFYMRLS